MSCSPVLTLPLLSFVLARKVAGSTQSLTLNLAMRRNEVEPGSTMRVVTGLVLLVYAASLAQGILIEENQVTRPSSPAQDYSIALSGLTARQQHDLADVPDVRAHALTMDSWVDLIGGSQVATELDAKRAIDEGARLAAAL